MTQANQNILRELIRQFIETNGPLTVFEIDRIVTWIAHGWPRAEDVGSRK